MEDNAQSGLALSLLEQREGAVQMVAGADFFLVPSSFN